MRKSIFSIAVFLLLAITNSNAQDNIKVPDYKKIEKNIEKKGSNLFYDTLFQRFVKADSTFTMEEKQHLYYGYVFNKKYDPYGGAENDKAIYEKLNLPNVSISEFKEILVLCEKQVENAPFDIRIYNVMLYLTEKLDDSEKYNKVISKLNIIVDAIFNSGDGKTKETAFYVIYVPHEYDIINILGLKFGGEQKLVDHYDYLKLADNKFDVKGLYFDISPSLNYLEKMLK